MLMQSSFLIPLGTGTILTTVLITVASVMSVSKLRLKIITADRIQAYSNKSSVIVKLNGHTY